MEHSDMMRGGALMAYRITERFVLVEAILLSGKETRALQCMGPLSGKHTTESRGLVRTAGA